jgi:hypothetical protein
MTPCGTVRIDPNFGRMVSHDTKFIVGHHAASIGWIITFIFKIWTNFYPKSTDIN